MKLWFRSIAFLVFSLTPLPAFPGGETSSLTEAQQARAQSLYKTFIAPCCWRQSVAVHNSPQATQVRTEIDAMVTDGRSNLEIKDALIREYGHGILMETEGARKVAVYTVPAVALLAGLMLTAVWIRRHRPVG